MARKLEFEIAGKSNVDPAVNQAKNSINKLKKDVEKAFDFKGAISSAFLGAIGAAALLSKAIGVVTEGFRELAKIADEQEKSGIGAEEYQRLAFVAEDAGVSLSTLTKAIRELKKFMREARDDTDKMKIMTEGLGFTSEQVKKGIITETDMIKRLSVVLKQYDNDLDKATIMTALFSEKSNELIPVFESMDDPKILNGLLVATKQQLKLIDETDSAWSRLWNNIKTGSAIVTAEVTAGLMKAYAGIEYYYQTGGSLNAFALTKSGRAEFEKWYAKQLNPPVAETKTVSTEQAKAQLDVFKKSQDTSGTKNSTISGSFNPENGPTGGVIGVGNNAQNIMLSEQVDLLTQIRDILKNTTPQGSVDFTKQMLDRTRFTA